MYCIIRQQILVVEKSFQPQSHETMLSPYGHKTLVTILIFCALLGGAGFFSSGLLQIALFLAAAVTGLFTIFFYRDPPRTPPPDKHVVLAPADGKILEVTKLSHPFTGHDSTRISIFMSLLNVHVNRIPLSGRIIHRIYHPGKFRMAFGHRSTAENEKMDIGIESGSLRLLFSQVAGFLARRIVCDLQIGDRVEAGSKFGMILFGSRLDIILPSKILPAVSAGEKTVAGKTVIGTFRQTTI